MHGQLREKPTLCGARRRCQANAWGGACLSRAFRSLRALSLATLWAAPLAAQEGPGLQQPCPDGRITAIRIENGSIFEVDDPQLEGRFRWALRTANKLHVRTKRSVIRRELLFAPGDCLDPFRIAETERLLRGYDFISRAEVESVPIANGDREVVVRTRDDWSTRIDLRLRFDNGLSLQGIALNEGNLFGTGQRLGVFFFERDVVREYGISFWTPQFARTRWDLGAAAGRTRPGSFFRQELAYPFVAEVGRWGGRQSFFRNDEFFDYIASDDPSDDALHVLLPTREKFFDVALVRRIGQRGNSALLGAGISYHQLAYPGTIEVAPGGNFDDREPADSAQVAEVSTQTEPLDNIRLSVMLGHRNVYWVVRRGLEGLRAVQDVRLGAEAGLVLGRSIPSLEVDDDLAFTFTLYTGVAAGSTLLVARGRTDVRRDLEVAAGAEEWEDLYADGEVLAFWQTGTPPGHTLFLRAAGLAGWNTRTPFQLTLGGQRALRGYDDERFPGGRRAVVTAEHRAYLGWPYPQLFDIGTTIFADAGRMWPGDVPFGTDSGWRASAGVGLRAAFPNGSRTTYRIDFAWPLERGTSLGDFIIRFSIGDPHGISGGVGDLQFLRSRPESVGGSLFQFRN